MKYQTWKGKMLYTPGIISLVLFIPLSLFFLEKLHVFEQFRVLEIVCHDPKTGLYVSPGDIYFTDVILSGSDKDDHAQLFLVESLVETLVKSGDTQGVCVCVSMICLNTNYWLRHWIFVNDGL
jgi:hypothetical protein